MSGEVSTHPRSLLIHNYQPEYTSTVAAIMSNCLTLTVGYCVSSCLKKKSLHLARLSTLESSNAGSCWCPFSFMSTIFRTSAFSQTSTEVLNVFCQRADLVVSFTALCLASPASSQLSSYLPNHPLSQRARPTLPCSELATCRSHQG